MDFKTGKILESLKNKKAGVFYDSANLYHACRKYGWRVDLERFKKFTCGKRSLTGKMDVEIVLDVVRTINDLDAIIVVSGDSDFLELKNYIVREKGKSILFMGYKENMAWELRLCQHLYINKIRNEVELKQNKPQILPWGSVNILIAIN